VLDVFVLKKNVTIIGKTAIIINCNNITDNYIATIDINNNYIVSGNTTLYNDTLLINNLNTTNYISNNINISNLNISNIILNMCSLNNLNIIENNITHPQ
jgi:hypothetical protein